MPYGARNIWGATAGIYAISTKGSIPDVARHPRTCPFVRLALRRLYDLSRFAPELSVRDGALDERRGLDADVGRPCHRRHRHDRLRYFRATPRGRICPGPHRKREACAGAPASSEADARGSDAPEAPAALFGDQALLGVFAALAQEGEETRIVGGALRNALLGRPVHEIDLATTLVPEAIMARATSAGLRVIPTGVAHGTVTVLAGKRTFELTTLREDIATDGRYAKVLFGRDFKADALRRDFTMNALSMTRDGRLFDYTGGLADIAARKVRFIGEPARRIEEDYLRILRFFRFSADFGEGPLDCAGRSAPLRQREGLASLSRERIHAELLKLLCARRGADVCAEICADGLLHPLLALAPNPARLRRVVAIGDGLPQDPLLRLAALCVELPEDAARLRERLRLSNAEGERLGGAALALTGLHGLSEPPKPDGLPGVLFG